MLPVARSVLRRIGEDRDVVTFVSRYTRGRFASGVSAGSCAGAAAARRGHRPVSDPDPASRAELRSRYGLGQRPTVVCLSRLVPRKGQDMLIRALPLIRRRVNGAALVIAGGGSVYGGAAPTGRAL